MNTNYKSLILAISLFFALSAPISAAPGDLDPTFGSGGIVITNGGVSLRLYYAWAMAIQSDGKIIVVGEGATPPFDTYNWDFAVVRYNPDGTLDSSFGGSGIVITPVGGDFDQPTSVAIQTDGKIVVAGSVYGSTRSFALVRYNTDGSLDASFNGTGKVITPVGTFGEAHSVAIQADGKIVVAGISGDGSTRSFALVRYNTDGSLDASFNGTGKVITPGGGATSVAIQSDGKIIAAGESRDGTNPAFTLVRYNANGTPDTSFNGTGKVITSVGNSGSGASDLAIQIDGKIVAAGYSLAVPGDLRTSNFALVRYTPDGTLDSSFGGTGKILIPDSDLDRANSVAIQSNGKIVVVGSIRLDFESAVVRFNTNGSLDTSFNGTGIVFTSFSDSYDHASSVAIQADGKIVVAGDTGPDEFRHFVVVRYQGDSISPTSCPNPIDCPDFFVRQQYLDFLGREPDSNGFANWMATLGGCPNGGYGEFDNPHCDRVHVSAGFYQSEEFQARGFWAYRFYEVALDRRPAFAEFIPDMLRVGGPQSPQSEITSKAAYTNDFVLKQEFRNRYDGLSNAAYLNALEQNAEVTLTNKQALLDALNAGTKTRALVLREVVENQLVFNRFFNRGFVSMQYFGYLRRDPDTVGFQNWVSTLDADQNNFRHMIFGFIYSTEYRARFGQP